MIKFHFELKFIKQTTISIVTFYIYPKPFPNFVKRGVRIIAHPLYTWGGRQIMAGAINQRFTVILKWEC